MKSLHRIKFALLAFGPLLLQLFNVSCSDGYKSSEASSIRQTVANEMGTKLEEALSTSSSSAIRLHSGTNFSSLIKPNELISAGIDLAASGSATDRSRGVHGFFHRFFSKSVQVDADTEGCGIAIPLFVKGVQVKLADPSILVSASNPLSDAQKIELIGVMMGVLSKNLMAVCSTLTTAQLNTLDGDIGEAAIANLDDAKIAKENITTAFGNIMGPYISNAKGGGRDVDQLDKIVLVISEAAAAAFSSSGANASDASSAMRGLIKDICTNLSGVELTQDKKNTIVSSAIEGASRGVESLGLSGNSTKAVDFLNDVKAGVSDAGVTVNSTILDQAASKGMEHAGVSSSIVSTVASGGVIPVLAFTSPAANYLISPTNMASVAVTGTCSVEGTVNLSGALTADVTCSSGTFSTNLNFTSAAEGNLTLNLDMTDSKGKSATRVSRIFIKDTTAPVLAFSTPAASSYVSSTGVSAFTIAGTCTEDGTVTISGAVSSTATCASGVFSKSLNVSSLSEGNFTLNLDMDDAAGNHATQKSRTFVKDTTAPVLAFSSPAASTLFKASGMAAFTVTGTCTEDGTISFSGASTSTVACSSGTFSKSFDFSASSEGNLTLNMDMDDAAGNHATQKSRIFIKDTTAPVIAFSSPAASTLFKASGMAAFTVTGTCTEDGTISFSGAATTTASCASGTFSKDFDFSASGEGNLTLNIDLDDAVGNHAVQKSRVFIKDTTAPVIAFSTPAALAYANSSNASAFTITGTCTEDGNIVISGAVSSTATCSSGTFSKSLNVSGLSEGNFTINLDMDDAIGNHATQKSRDFTKDTVLPVIAFSTPAASTYFKASGMAAFTVTGTCTEDGTISFTGAATSTVSCSSGTFSKSFDFSASGEGNLTLNMDLDDAAGNHAVQKSRIFIKDTTTPVLAFSTPAADSMVPLDHFTDFTITGTCSETATISISGAVTSTVSCSGGTFTKNLDVSGVAYGSFTLNLDFTDAAGNTATQVTRSFTNVIPQKMILFLTSSTTTGNIGSLNSANTLCNNSSNKPSGRTGKAIVSFGSSEEVRDMPALLSFSADTEVLGSNRTTIASSWNTMLAGGSLSTSLTNAGMSSADIWTFSNSDGSLHTNNCQNGTSSSSSDSGEFGRTSRSDDWWIAYTDNSCDQSKSLACMTIPGPAIEVSKLSQTSVSESGTTSTFTVRLATEPTGNVTMAVSSSDTTEGTVNKSSLTFTSANWYVPQVVTVTGADDGSQDGPISYAITFGNSSSSDGNYNNIATPSLSITTIDNEPVPPYILYLSTNRYDGGEYGGYSGANSICNADGNKPSGRTGYAMMSQGAGHQMKDLATLYGLDTSTAIQSAGGTVIASNWAALFSGTLTNSLQAAGLGTYAGFWTNSNADGTASATNCSSGSSSSSGVNGEVGKSEISSNGWINYYSNTQCDFIYHILCIAKAY